MRKTMLLVSGLFFVAALGFHDAALARPKHRLKISIQPPERSAWGQTLRTISKEIAERTNGEVQLKVYPGGVQGNERTVLRKMRVGQLHGGVFLSDGLTDICPDSLVLGLPLMFRDHTEVTRALDEVGPALEKQARDNGYEILAWPQLGFSYLFSREEIREMDELRRAKPWLMEKNPVGHNLFDVLRMTPVSTSVANVLPSLESGLIRTVFCPPLVLIAMQWHSRIKYRLDMRITFSVGAFVIGKRAWSRLPDPHRKAVREVFERNNAKLNARIRRENQEALKVLEKQGIATLAIETASRKEFEQATTAISKKMAQKEFSEAILSRLQSFLEVHRKSAPEK